jgi:hypothetical protein
MSEPAEEAIILGSMYTPALEDENPRTLWKYKGTRKIKLMLDIIAQKLVKEDAKGVLCVIICQGIMGFFACFASIATKTMVITTEPTSDPITNG